ncbi:MAG: bifunctional 2-polyprenyl-6-hydroxyphenol methylase/3-demethylubiquinol 3-O-methyltransferase UbiG [Pseudomonadales bacterium]|nr:bifunctional 2-polyprenyl-6-hydroxyphenol methylase/3-demethylubiquinol 3-O-methyltransferase UbiG [Pseudomonadales bacterium]
MTTTNQSQSEFSQQTPDQANSDQDNSNKGNVDPREVAKFDDLARKWWDTNSEFKPLHDINPLRMEYILSHVSIAGSEVLDVGCGGGILTESLAKAGARVTGIDMAAKPLKVAKLHRHESNLEINYQLSTIEAFATMNNGEHQAKFDVITCLEMMEHVPDPGSVIQACKTLLKPGGHLFLSTINRNAKAYLMLVIGAEYLLNMLPRGTHDYDKFIKPSELAGWLRQSSFELNDISGMSYNPVSKGYRLSKSTEVNYLIYASC